LDGGVDVYVFIEGKKSEGYARGVVGGGKRKFSSGSLGGISHTVKKEAR